jgi:hypothetical protein
MHREFEMTEANLRALLTAMIDEQPRTLARLASAAAAGEDNRKHRDKPDYLEVRHAFQVVIAAVKADLMRLDREDDTELN